MTTLGFSRDHIERWRTFERGIQPRGIPLFETDSELLVATHSLGSQGRTYLRRSRQMEELMRATMQVLRSDFFDEHHLEGLIYVMYWLRGDDVLPLYIGKAGATGRQGGFSTNLTETNSTRRFGRWGDGYAYHIGDLSAAVFGHPRMSNSAKYKRWADQLFQADNRLREPTYFWCSSVQRWQPTPDGKPSPSLDHYERELIRVAAMVYPETLLNTDGT